jgi:hypothetical protein
MKAALIVMVVLTAATPAVPLAQSTLVGGEIVSLADGTMRVRVADGDVFVIDLAAIPPDERDALRDARWVAVQGDVVGRKIAATWIQIPRPIFVPASASTEGR